MRDIRYPPIIPDAMYFFEGECLLPRIRMLESAKLRQSDAFPPATAGARC